MPDLPPAIQFILPELAADAGRGRAVTLLSILGAGPDYLRTRLTDIDAALGVDSPGAAGLEDLIASAEEAVSTSQPTVKHQHVISQVVLRKYVEEVPPGGRQLARFDVSTGVPRLDGTNGVGYVDDFVPVDSKATEDLWQQVEGGPERGNCRRVGGIGAFRPEAPRSTPSCGCAPFCPKPTNPFDPQLFVRRRAPANYRPLGIDALCRRGVPPPLQARASRPRSASAGCRGCTGQTGQVAPS